MATLSATKHSMAKTTPARKPVARKLAQQQVRVQTTRYQKPLEVQRLEKENARLEKENNAFKKAERKRQLTAKIPIPPAPPIPLPKAPRIPLPGETRYYQEETHYYQRKLIKETVVMVLFGILGQHRGHSYQSSRFIFPSQTQSGISAIGKNQLADPNRRH